MRYVISEPTSEAILKQEVVAKPNNIRSLGNDVPCQNHYAANQAVHRLTEKYTLLQVWSSHCSQGHIIKEQETVFIASPNILFATMVVNSSNILALIDTGASVSLISEKMVNNNDIVPGKPIRVCSYDGT